MGSLAAARVGDGETHPPEVPARNVERQFAPCGLNNFGSSLRMPSVHESFRQEPHPGMLLHRTCARASA